MHMEDGCLGLLRLRPDPVHKFPLHSEAACRLRGPTVARLSGLVKRRL